jgi:predicted Zn-ribbon and HTH transcriptional regulator
MSADLIFRLRKRAEIRRQIETRKSVQEGKPDRIADLLDEAATALERAEGHVKNTCPNCNGTGKVEIEDDYNGDSYSKRCPACEGHAACTSEPGGSNG